MRLLRHTPADADDHIRTPALVCESAPMLPRTRASACSRMAQVLMSTTSASCSFRHLISHTPQKAVQDFGIGFVLLAAVAVDVRTAVLPDCAVYAAFIRSTREVKPSCIVSSSGETKFVLLQSSISPVRWYLLYYTILPRDLQELPPG